MTAIRIRRRSGGGRLLLAILLIAFALRVYRLDSQSLWYDEAVTAQVASQGIAELTRWTADDIQPPLYYVIVAGWTRLAGRNEWMLRFPSVFFSLLTVALLWTLARRLFGARRSPWRRAARQDPAAAAAAGASLVAALLGAFSPLYVYYAQEARMYALLTFLASLAGYALLRAVHARAPRPSPWRRAARQGDLLPWIAFVLASAAMLYVHYFGAFLLAAYALCLAVAWVVGGGSPRRACDLRSLIKPAGALLAILLLYLPWLPAMLTRYRVDRSYWQGSLKLGEALRHLAISFTVGAPEMMLEPDAVRLLPWFGLLLMLAVVGLVCAKGGRTLSGRVEAQVETSRRDVSTPLRAAAALRTLRVKSSVCGYGSILALSAVLLLPTLAIVALAARTPKFNARYLMMVSPAYLLILAGGIGVWVSGVGDWVKRHAPHNTRYLIRDVVFLALVAFPLATSAVSLRNWFSDPAFTKAQWREVAAAVRSEIGPDEAVLLVSGHAYPAWDAYAADISRTRLPATDILDVEAVLGFEDGATLARELAGRTGVWLVSWQAEAADPVGFVPYFLDRAGTEQPVPGQFWHVELRHWLLRPDATYPTEPRPQHIQAANYAHQVALLGWDDPAGGLITVYWRGINTIRRDYQVSLILEDAGGQEVGRWDGRPAGYDYPTFRWRPGQALFGRYPLPAAALDGGDYYVTLALYDAAEPSGLDLRDVADNPAGKRVRLGPVRLK